MKFYLKKAVFREYPFFKLKIKYLKNNIQISFFGTPEQPLFFNKRV